MSNFALNKEKKPLILTGNELGDFGEDKPAWRKAALDYYKNSLQGNSAVREDIGEIRFTNKGIKKTITASADETKLKYFPALREILATGKTTMLQPPIKPRNDGITGFRHIEAAIRINGENKTVIATVAQDSRGNLFYNINNKVPVGTL